MNHRPPVDPARARHRWPCLAALLLSALAVPPPGSAGEARSGGVLNASLTVTWMAGGDRGWYRRQGMAGHEFILIDATAGTRTVAFDHQAMAKALAVVLGRQVTETALPITAIEMLDDGSTVLVEVAGKEWFEGPRSAATLIPSTRATRPAFDRVPRPTRETGAATSLAISNRSVQTIELMWSDAEGRRKSYGRLPPGSVRNLDTFVGHVWLAVDARGEVLAVVEAQAVDQVVEIDGVTEPRPGSRKKISEGGPWQVQVKDHNLWLRPMSGDGEPVALTTDGTPEASYHSPRWSPDASHLAAFKVVAGERRTITLIESTPKDQVQPRSRTVRYDKPGDRIDETRVCLFRIEDRARVAIDAGLLETPWSIDGLAWNEDSSGFTVLFNQRGHQLMRVVEVRRDGSTRAVIEERAPTFIDYAGKSFFRRVDQGRAILWLSERDGWNHLYRYDARTGQVANRITGGAWAVRAVEHVDEQAGLIWFTAGGMVPGEDPYHVHHCRVAFDGSGLTRLTDGDGTHTVQWSPDRRWFIDTWSRVDLPPQHVLRDGRTGKQVMALEQADISTLRASGWQQPERFVAKGRDGTTDIHGVLWRPKNFDPAKRYPVVEDIYAGPHAAHVPKAFRARYRQQEIADLGFIVGMVDGMGTSHRSKAFHDVCWKNLADAGFPDRIPWWQAAAMTRPWMDLSRVGIYGGSAGGQSAMGALLFHPQFYHVAVADCGCHDNRMDKIWWNELWMGWPVGPHYAEQSNVTNAHKLQGKLMLIVGEIDDNVDPQSTHQVAHALQKAGKDFELVVVHGHGHGAAETSFGKKKRAGFLVRHLGSPRE